MGNHPVRQARPHQQTSQVLHPLPSHGRNCETTTSLSTRQTSNQTIIHVCSREKAFAKQTRLFWLRRLPRLLTPLCLLTSQASTFWTVDVSWTKLCGLSLVPAEMFSTLMSLCGKMIQLIRDSQRSCCILCY